MPTTLLITPEAVMASVEIRMGGAWIWGDADCCTSASAVFADLHGIDPMSSLRGRYHGPLGAARLIAAAGGMAVLGQQLADAKRLRITAGRTGDIGIVQNGTGLAAAICVQPGMWAGKALEGFMIVKQAVASWGV